MLEVHHLTKIYKVGKLSLAAVNNVSLSIDKGEIVGIVGESGSGKSTLGRILLRLIEPTSGKVLLEGQDIKALSRRFLSEKMQIIFQDPQAALNPRMTIGDLIDEPLKIRKKPSRCNELLERVGLPQNAKNRFPHEFSGGQRQRIVIARALALNPEFLVCDEPISSLDISIQAQIINLLQELQQELKLTYLFIAHDLAIVRHFCTRVAVMHKGSLIETAPTEKLYTEPEAPYTKALLASSLQLKHSSINGGDFQLQ